jgi:hypothetical protein
MIRLILQAVLPFLIPFAAYGAYRLLMERSGPWLERGHWLPLALAGLILAGISLAYMGLTTGAPAGSVYVPPHMEDGRLVPGQFEPAPDD